MSSRRFLTAALVAGLALGASAEVSLEYIDWAKGPVQFLMTRDELAKWKTVRTNDEARAFAALFWARRDPTPGTARNEAHEDFEVRVDYADRNLANGERLRGAMTDRGKALILYGMPKRMSRSATTQQLGSPDLQADPRETAQFIQWTYEESDEVKEIFGVPRATLRFVDRFGLGDYKLERGAVDLNAAAQRAVARRITQPELSVAPSYSTPAAPAAVESAPAQAAAAVQTELATASLQKAIDDFRTSPKSAKTTHVSWGEYVTAGGEYFVPVMLYVPKSSGIAASENLTFFGVVQDAGGKNVQAFEVPAALVPTKNDLYVDRSLKGLPAGNHRGYFGLAENGTVVSLVAADMSLAGSLDRNAPAVSGLILSNHLYPLTAAQRPDDPYAFGGLKVVPKADRTFTPADELWYFVELRNPGVVQPGPTDAVPIVGAVVAGPKVQIKIDVEGTDVDGNRKKMSAPPREVDAVEIKGVPGHYGVGSAIPLATFKPGDYTFTMKVIDTVRKASYTVSDTFRVTP
jgi:GWxTD domain-containing protein